MKANGAIAWAYWLFQTQLAPRLATPSNNERPPSLMDVQNTFCEFSKYMRYLRGEPERRTFRPAHPGPQPTSVLPEHW